MTSNPWDIYLDYDYMEFWEGREYEDKVERIALSSLLYGLNGNIVDLGANYGRLGELYEGFENKILLDGSETSINQAYKHWKNHGYHCINCDMRSTPFPPSYFNVVIIVRTLHCLSDIAPVFSEVRRILKNGGYFIFEFANKKNIKQLTLSLFGKSKRNPFELSPTKVDSNILNFHPLYIENLLSNHGFSIENRLGVSILRDEKIKSKFNMNNLVSIDTIFQEIAGRLYLSPSIFIRAKKI